MIIEIASIISALTIIIGFYIKITQLSINILNKIDDFDKRLRYNELHLRKLALFNKGLPIQDRLQAGKEYIELGGNGAGKLMYEKLLDLMDNAIDNDFYCERGDK